MAVIGAGFVVGSVVGILVGIAVDATIWQAMDKSMNKGRKTQIRFFMAGVFLHDADHATKCCGYHRATNSMDTNLKN